MSFTAVRVDWTETERGWGTRPDGTTLHKDMATAKAYIDVYWLREHARTGGVTPDEYSYPHEPEVVTVTEANYQRAQADGSFWASDRAWPRDL